MKSQTTTQRKNNKTTTFNKEHANSIYVTNDYSKFKFKDNVEEGFKLGVVAQEIEKTAPHLVSEAVDRDVDGKDLGTTTKSVKYSVLQMKGLVALQEAMKRIEELEAKVKALEAK